MGQCGTYGSSLTLSFSFFLIAFKSLNTYKCTKITAKLSHFTYTWLSFYLLLQHFLLTPLEIARWHMTMKLIFEFIKRFGTGPLQLVKAFAILASNSRIYWYSKIDSPLSTMYREPPTPRIGDTASYLQIFLYTVYNSLYLWYRELSTVRITDMASRKQLYLLLLVTV
jgi:hypothetical protein